MLELTNRKLEHAEVVAAKGRLDSTTSRRFEAHCDDLLGAGCHYFVFDFQELQCLSSEGLRAILGLCKRIQARGGTLVFTGVHGVVRDMFNIAGFLDAYPVVDRWESSLA